MSHKITINPGGANETVYNAGKINQLDFVKTHTALGDYSVRLPHDFSLENRLGDEIHLEKTDGTFLFRGFVRDVSNVDEYRVSGGGQLTEYAEVAGKGIGFDLTRNETTRSPSNILVSDEIQNVWDLTGFSASVTAPSANTSTSGNQVQEANTNAEFNGITSNISDTDPLAVQNGNIEVLDSAFVQDDADATVNPGFNSNEDGYNDGTYTVLNSAGQAIEWEFTTNYEIPRTDVAVRLFVEAQGTDEHTLTVSIDDENIVTGFETNTSLEWDFVGRLSTQSGDTGTLPTGTHTLRTEVDAANTDNLRMDVMAVYDENYSYTFDNSLSSTQGYLDGPQTKPDSVDLTLDQQATTWRITSASVNSTWTATSGNQRIQLRLPPDGSYAPSDGTEDNTSSLSNIGFGSDEGSAVQARLRFGRYGSRSGETPLTGFNGTDLTDWEITITGDDVPVITEDTYEGSWFSVQQSLHADGRMHWKIPHQANSKTVESFPIGSDSQAEPDWTIRDREKTKTLEAGYANNVTVRGSKKSDGTKLKVTVNDSSEESTFGVEHFEANRPDLDTLTKVERTGRQILQRKLQQKEIQGKVTVVAIDLDPGSSYPVTWLDGTSDEIIAEEIRYSVLAGELRGTVVGNIRSKELGSTLAGQRGDLFNTQRGI